MKVYAPNWPQDVPVVKKAKNTVLWTYVSRHVDDEETVGGPCEKELQNTNQPEFRVEKVINRKGSKLFVKLKG